MSNGARLAAAPLSGGGTSVRDWLSVDRAPLMDLSECPALVVVAPHPDDETLGLGGTLAQLAAGGTEVSVVSVSDGGAAYPGISKFDQLRLEQTRRAELDRAAAALGVKSLTRLGLPDGAVADHEDRLADLLTEQLSGSGAWCAATWRGDGHPDHEAVGRAAAVASERAGVTFVEYPVWMWHWAQPADPDVPWQRAVSVPLDRQALGRKQRAAQCFRSQFEPPEPGLDPVLPPIVLRRLLAVGEVLFR
ncbi:LmbE family protein [Mycobacterium sp. MS1601]|uniref:PIG-L deacetylase family protein n=1 Tax=Mycobacterium sp. MS1601 TaxID=1936029 RepID=UPI00097930CB|nr:PIG-L family deacetylase [Mycobacterium sp. MS1601]AQA01930.1 LmbE family protein [Mycobacterium sp. MS1601]